MLRGFFAALRVFCAVIAVQESWLISDGVRHGFSMRLIRLIQPFFCTVPKDTCNTLALWRVLKYSNSGVIAFIFPFNLINSFEDLENKNQIYFYLSVNLESRVGKFLFIFIYREIPQKRDKSGKALYIQVVTRVKLLQ